MNKILSLFLLCLPFFLAGQSDNYLDSLKVELGKTNIPSQRAEIYDALAAHYYNEQQDSLALEIIEKGLKLVTAEQDVLKGNFLYKKAMLYYYGGIDYEATKAMMEEAKVLYKNAEDDLKIKLHQSYGSILISYQEFDKGIAILTEAEQIGLKNIELGHPDRMLNIYSNLLAAAQSKGDYTTALEYARKGLEFGKKSNNYEMRADLRHNNALNFLGLGYDEEAEQEYLKSLKLSQEGKLPHSVATVNMSLGQFYNSRQQLKKGEKCLLDAQKYFEEVQDGRSLAILDKMLADNAYKQKGHSTALNYINSAIAYFENTNDPRGVQGNYYTKADILAGMNALDSAIVYAQKELKIAQSNNSGLYLYSTYLQLSEIEKQRQNFEVALNYHEKYINVKDSIYNADLEDKIAEERTKQNLEAAQEAQKNAELEAQLLTSRNQLIGSAALGLLAILLVGGYLFWQLQKTRKQLENQNLQLQQLNTTKDKFFGIIAHDIRSPITALEGVGEQMQYYLSKNHEKKLLRLADRVDSTAKRLQSLLDNLLNWALLQTGTIPYHPKSLNLQTISNDIFELYQPLADAKNIMLKNDIQTEKIVYADESAMNTIIRNLVNNALKFTPKGGTVNINAEEQNDKIFIEINDTGTGISAEKLPKLFSVERTSTKGTAGEKGSGLGLMLCKELVELNKGTIQAISELGKGAKFIVGMPVK